MKEESSNEYICDIANLLITTMQDRNVNAHDALSALATCASWILKNNEKMNFKQFKKAMSSYVASLEKSWNE